MLRIRIKGCGNQLGTTRLLQRSISERIRGKREFRLKSFEKYGTASEVLIEFRLSTSKNDIGKVTSGEEEVKNTFLFALYFFGRIP